MEFCGYNFYFIYCQFFSIFRFVSFLSRTESSQLSSLKFLSLPIFRGFPMFTNYIYRDTKIADGPFIYGFLFYSILFSLFFLSILFCSFQYNSFQRLENCFFISINIFHCMRCYLFLSLSLYSAIKPRNCTPNKYGSDRIYIPLFHP